MQEKTVTVPAIHCGNCARTIRNELAEVDGVEAVHADPETKQVTVRWREPATWDRIRDVLADIDFPPADA